MKATIPVLVLLAAAQVQAGGAAQATGKPATAQAEPEMKMEKYYLVLLERPSPPPPKLPAAEGEEIQKRHLGHLKQMWLDGKMVIAGPFDEQEDAGKRGLCLYRVASAAEARALAEQDPAVKAGRLKVEVMAWWVEKGYVSFRAPPPK